MTVGDGILALARLTGAPILPLAVSVSRRKVLRTWDRLIVPLPFGRGAMIWGNPITVPRDAGESDLARLRLTLEEELTRVSAEADTFTGHAAMTKDTAESANARA